MTDPMDTDALQAARRQRRDLQAALVALESAAASAATGHRWLDELSDRVDEVDTAFAHHVEETESEDGLLAETIGRAPRLGRRAQLLRDDHVAITAAIAEATRCVTACAEDRSDDNVATLRTAVTDVMGRLTRHRQLGADFVFDAYHVDIEAAD